MNKLEQKYSQFLDYLNSKIRINFIVKFFIGFSISIFACGIVNRYNDIHHFILAIILIIIGALFLSLSTLKNK